MLLAYAAYADPDGSSIYPSKPTIAHDTRFSLRTVKTATSDLLDAGFLTIADDQPTKRFGEGPRAWTRLYRIDYSSLGLAAENTAEEVQEIPVVKADEVQLVPDEVQLSHPRSAAVAPNHPLYQSIDQSSSSAEEEQSMNLQIQELAEQIAGERLKATPTKVTNPRAWINAVRIKPDVIEEARDRYAEEQQRLEHANCDRCEGNAWMNCAGPFTETELAAAEETRQARAAEVRATAAGWHSYRARPDKPDACTSCGKASDVEIHDVDVMARA